MYQDLLITLKHSLEIRLENLEWMEPFSSVHNGEFIDSKWFENGKINIAYNCIDQTFRNACR